MTRKTLISAAVLVALMSAPASAAIPQGEAVNTASPLNAQSWQLVQREISAREAKAIALARVPGGEVVDIRRTSDAYRVRIIARDGRVVDIIVDAATGRIR
ncbi:hypothetical protein GCM10009069_24910 [Algimonas arctica]|uniref:PepSY domain-containing protein n=1 Tax=Algimonas arctica TaxID=1479486 RepID=A0A8J3CSW7_9PROT|nr:PepSY domain-containing protein [Algimonas arctica]GHB01120.1 hypothetical protein GCM10009069_24910 [Algimonas arctica]